MTSAINEKMQVDPRPFPSSTLLQEDGKGTIGFFISRGKKKIE
jgi:hypothetical protein